MNDIFSRDKRFIFRLIFLALPLSAILIFIPWISFPTVHKIFIGTPLPTGSDSPAIFYNNVFTTFFTGFTALFTGLSAIGLIYTLGLQRESSASQLEAIEKQTANGEKQITTVQDNAFDTIFFELFNNYKKEISNLSLTSPLKKTLKGYDVIKYLASLTKKSKESFGWKKDKQTKFVHIHGFGGSESPVFIKIAEKINLEIAANYLFIIFHKIRTHNSTSKASRAKNILYNLLSIEEKYVLGNYRFITYKMKNIYESKNKRPNIADQILKHEK